PDDLKSITLFRKFLANDMLKRLVEHTNLYSTQNYGSSVNTSALELEQYIGMYLQMGLVKKPNARSYWEQDTRYSPIADTMSRNHFLKLRKCLHVVNNLEVTEDENEDKRILCSFLCLGAVVKKGSSPHNVPQNEVILDSVRLSR
ncbi:hypothetical protein HPB47_023943, partial [Ixodes persulcatus]